jgi:hypothetical protein
MTNFLFQKEPATFDDVLKIGTKNCQLGRWKEGSRREETSEKLPNDESTQRPWFKSSDQSRDI